MKKTLITYEILQKAYDYQSYRKLIDILLEQKKTTGTKHSEEYLELTRLNIQRMKRWDKTTIIEPYFTQFLKQIKKKIFLVVLTEAWCGDAANLVPIFEKIRLENPNYLSYHLLLRDENPEIMDDNLTNGSRSIPKLIFLNENMEKVATWGPRPVPLVNLIQAWKSNGLTYEDYAEKIQLWYAKDQSFTTQKEIFEVLKSIIGPNLNLSI